MNSPVREFVEFLLVRAEHCTREEAWARLEGTRLMALLQENVFIHSRTVERPHVERGLTLEQLAGKILWCDR